MTCGKLARRRNGVALIYAMIMLTVVVGFASFAVDLARVRLVKAELVNAVDAATRAACAGLAVSPAQARSLAKASAAENTANNAPLILLDGDIELGKWNTATRTFTLLTGAAESTADAVRVTGQLRTARGSAVPLTFLPVLGGASAKELTTSSVATRASGRQDIVIVQDVSLSFYNEVALARTGDKSVLDSLYASGGTSSFGLVAFTGKAVTVAPLKNVVTNYSSLTAAVNSLSIQGTGMPSVVSGTDIAAGMEAAQTVFNNYVQASPNRAMIIVSDGASTQSSQGAHPTLNAAQLLTKAQQDADTAWAQKIDVYVVFWDSANDPTEAANLKTLIRGQGKFVQVTDATQLAAAIGKVFTNTQLVK